jgi:hypothetical protein
MFASAAGVEFVVILGDLHHPRLDEGILIQHLVLHPGAGLRQRPRQGESRPWPPMDQPSDFALQFVVSRAARLTDQQRELRRQLAASIDDAVHCIDQIFEMQVRLSAIGLAGEQIAGGLLLVDAGDLLRQECRPAILVIDAGEAQDHGGDFPALPLHDLFGLGLGIGIRPFWLDRPILVDRLAALARGVDQQRARKDKLLDLEAPA